MKRYQRFVARHPLICPLISLALGWGYAWLMIILDASPWLALLFLPIFIIAVGQSLTATNVLQLPALKALDEQCDPIPLLNETTELLGFVKGRGQRVQLTINRTAALIELGQTEQASAELRLLHSTDLLPGSALLQVYYQNMAACELAQEDGLARAQVWYELAQQNLSAIKPSSMQKPFVDGLRLLSADMALVQGDIPAAEAVAQVVTPNSLRQQVDKAWLLARIAHAKGDAAVARWHLDFVIQNGNTLYVVQQAQQLETALQAE